MISRSGAGWLYLVLVSLGISAVMFIDVTGMVLSPSNLKLFGNLAHVILIVGAFLLAAGFSKDAKKALPPKKGNGIKAKRVSFVYVMPVLTAMFDVALRPPQVRFC